MHVEDFACRSACVPIPEEPGTDQAATLRTLFTPAGARLLPVLLPAVHDGARTAWLVKLAQGFSRQGERTLIVDGARAQIAAGFGLRARYDLAHELSGECAAGSARLDVRTGLSVLPAARALATWGMADMRLHEQAQRAAADLVLLLLPAQAAPSLPAGDVLLPVVPSSRDLSTLISTLQWAVATPEPPAFLSNSGPAPKGSPAETGCFRLLFLGMDRTPAATLMQRLMERVNEMTLQRPARRSVGLSFAGAAAVARDLAGVVSEAAGWQLSRLAPPQTLPQMHDTLEILA